MNLNIYVYDFIHYIPITIYYKESCPFQLMCLQLMSKSTIFATIDVIVLYGTNKNNL
jgi:hypothetical protein